MTVAIRAACPTCGPQLLEPQAFRVQISKVEGAGARYSFHCWVCKTWVSRAADHLQIRALLIAGAVADVVPQEVLEHPAPETPPISEGDLTGFLDQLDSCEYPTINAQA